MGYTKNQENKINMIEDVDNFLDDNTVIVGTIAVLASKHTELKTKITNIRAKALEKDTVTSGKLHDKYDAQNRLIKATMAVAGPLLSFGKDRGMNDVIEDAHVTQGYLRNLRDNDIILKCQRVFDTATAHAGAILTYGVTAPMIALIQTEIDAYTIALGKRESSTTALSGATASLKDQFRDCLLHLETMDGIVEALKNTEPQFYTGYHFARVIRDLGSVKHVRKGNLAPSESLTVVAGGFTDASIFILKNKGTHDLMYCTSNVSGAACGSGVTVHPGDRETKTALELGLPGSQFLNVTNLDATGNGSYEVEF